MTIDLFRKILLTQNPLRQAEADSPETRKKQIFSKLVIARMKWRTTLISDSIKFQLSTKTARQLRLHANGVLLRKHDR